MDDLVARALHAVRHHLAGGGFLSDLFSGPDYLSTGEVASPTNWGDPESAADFFKADKAMRLAREVQAADDVTGSIPVRAPLTAPRPGPVEVQELPVNIPFTAPERGASLLSSDISPASVTSLPLAYAPAPTPAPAAAAINTATTPTTDKLTARVPQDVEPTTSNARILAAIRANESRNNPRAQNPTSSAGGLYQFLNSTWGNTLRRMDPERFGVYSDRQLRGLKTDPNAVDIQHAAANYHLTNDIAPRLSKAGVPLTPGSAYLSWFQGPGGAVRAYTAPDDATVAQVFPKTVSANANMRFNGKPYAQWTMSDLRQWADTAMAKRMGRAEGGEVEGYDKGGVIKKAMRAIQNYQDPATRKIADWNWRPLADVDADLGLTEIPPHVQAFGDYMRGMSDKAAGEGLTARDLIKGYTTTRASIQRRATDADLLRQLGLDLPDDVKMIRPEGAWAEWLGTPMGQRYLDAAARGDVEGDAVANAIKVMSPFGRHETDIPDSMKWAAQNLPGREATASDLVARAAQGASAPEEWRQFTSDIRGVGPSKSGFLASLYGRGDQPTLDARQIILNTGEPTKLAAPFLARSKGEGGVEAVDRLAARQSALGLQVPSQYNPFYQHLAHHSIWDKASNEMTTHGDVVKAMQDYAHGGLVDDALHVVREHHADGEAVGPTMQQRLRETIASIDPERSQDQPVMDPATMGEAWNRARQNYQNFPVQEGEAVARPLELGARDVIGGAIAGEARAPGADFRRGVADLLVGNTGLPNSGTLGVGVADLPMVTGIPLTLADMARDIGQGDYASTAMGAALPAAFYARGPLGAAGRRAVEIAKDYAKPIAGAAGVTATMTPEDAEAAKLSKALQVVRGSDLIKKDPKIADVVLSGRDLAGSDKLDMRAKDVEYSISPKNDLQPWKPFNPEDIYRERGYVVPALGDRSRAGAMLHDINGVKLTSPSTQQGGGEFKRSLEDPAIWASRQGMVTSMQSQLLRAMKDQNVPEGAPVFMSHTLMGYPSLDSTQMMAEAILRQIEPTRGKIDLKAAENFDNFVRKSYPEWPGILSPEAAEKFLKTKEVGARTSSILQALDKAEQQKGGLPNLGAARLAVMEPRLVSADQLSSGFAISQLDPYGRGNSVKHTTYTTPFLGDYRGGTEHQIPARLMFPEWFNNMNPQYLEKRTGQMKDTSPTMYQHGLMMQFPLQKANQEWLDNIMGHTGAAGKKWGYRYGGEA